MPLVLIAITILAVWAWNRHKAKQAREAAARRFEMLVARFGRAAAEAIVARQVWQGQTEEMLRESIGYPAATDQNVSASRVRLVHKYHPTGRGRFAMRVMVENGVVTGWELKE